MSIDLTNPIYHKESSARKYLEAIRWPHGAVCPYCGYAEHVKPLGGKSMGEGWYHCADCRKKFTVRVGTVYERSKIPLHKWVLATHLMCASKKGISAHQLHRMLHITYKSAWFMCHRIRESMRDPAPPPMGGEGTPVRADETYFGNREEPNVSPQRKGRPYIHKGGGPARKRAVFALISDGKARTFHIQRASAKIVREIMVTNVRRESELQTDESRIYTQVGREFAKHRTVNHSAGEYVRDGATINHVENYFSVFKRGMKGVYQHCGEKHLHRYLCEFDFRYNYRTALGYTDEERAALAFKGIEGKRLTYRRTAGRTESHAPLH